MSSSATIRTAHLNISRGKVWCLEISLSRVDVYRFSNTHLLISTCFLSSIFMTLRKFCQLLAASSNLGTTFERISRAISCSLISSSLDWAVWATVAACEARVVSVRNRSAKLPPCPPEGANDEDSLPKPFLVIRIFLKNKGWLPQQNYYND